MVRSRPTRRGAPSVVWLLRRACSILPSLQTLLEERSHAHTYRLCRRERDSALSEIGLRTPGVNPGVKARSRRLQVFLRRFCYHVGMKIKLSAHGAYHHQYHVVWIPKYRKKSSRGNSSSIWKKACSTLRRFILTLKSRRSASRS